MNRVQYLIKNTLIFALGTIGTKIVHFFLVPLYTNVLLPEEYGLADLVFTLGTFLVPILILNINESVLRFSLDKDADYNKIMSVGLVSLATMTVGASCAYPLIKLYQPIAKYSDYVCLYFISSGCNTVFMYNLRGKELLFQFSVGNIINAIMVASMNILFLTRLKLGLEGYFLAYIIANFVTMLYAFFAGNVISTIRNFRIDKKLMVSMLKYSLMLIPNSFMWWVMDSSNRVMLTAFAGVAVTGIYAVSAKLPSLVSIISTIFNQAWNYSAIKERDSLDSLDYNNSVFDYLIFVVIAFASMILLILKPFMRIYVEPSYFDSWRNTPPLIAGTVILVLSTFLATSYTVNKDSKGFLFSAIVGAVTNITSNFILIPIGGAFGAAISSCIGYAFVFVYRYFDTRKYLKLRVFTAKHVVAFLCLVCATIAVYFEMIGYVVISFELCVLLFTFRKNILSIFGVFKKMIKK